MNQQQAKRDYILAVAINTQDIRRKWKDNIKSDLTDIREQM
jgi:hypothetical protein